MVAIAFTALWFVLCRHLSGEWRVNEQYNYGWFVPLFAIYLFWLRWEDRPAAQAQVPNPKSQIPNNHQPSTINHQRLIAFAIAALALFLLLPLRVFEIGNPDWRPLGWVHTGAVAGLTLIYIWYVGGKAWLRHFAFPIAFFFVAVPWVSPIEEPIVQGLMRVIAAGAAETLTLFGIPAQVEGNLIRLPRGLVGVNEACSGVRSLQTSIMIGLLFGELKRLSILRRLGLVAGAVGIALVANFLRAFFLVWIAASKGLSETNRWHDLAGYVIVALVFLGTMLWANAFTRGQRSESSDSSFVIRHSSFIAAAVLCWLLLVEGAAAMWYRAHERNLITHASWTVQWPQAAPGYREIKIDEGVRSTLRFDAGREAVWKSDRPSASNASSTSTVYLFFFRWDAGSGSVLRARAHRPDICLPSAGWKPISDRGIKEISVRDNVALPIRRSTFRNERSGLLAHAFFVLQEDRLNPREERPDLSSPIGAQPDWSFVGRCRTVRHGIRNLGQQVLELIILAPAQIDDATAEQQFEEILQQIVVPR